jgi:hypothetical protein
VVFLGVVLLLAGYVEISFAQAPTPPTSSSLMESDTPGSPAHSTLVVVNNASAPVVAVQLGTDLKDNRLSSPIPAGDSRAVSSIQPTDYQCIRIAKSNDRADLLCAELKAGKTYTYTARDSEEDHATIVIVNRTSLEVVALRLRANDSANLLSSPIPPGGQSAITHIQPTALVIVIMKRSDGVSTLWGRTLNGGETSTYVMRDVDKKKVKRWGGLVALADGEEFSLR